MSATALFVRLSDRGQVRHFDFPLDTDLRLYFDTTSRDQIYMALTMDLHQSYLSADKISRSHRGNALFYP